jgi:uncharacterized repeat protein (TIGR03803 family)
MTSGKRHPNRENGCVIESVRYEWSLRQLARAVWRTTLAIALLSALLVLAARPAPAQTLTVLHGFGSGTDGANSRASLIRDTQGNLYGTTAAGGAYGYGTVFSLSSSGVEKILYTFTGGADGGSPYGSLIQDSQGNLYGTTFSGGAYGDGTVFMTTKTGVEIVLHSFGSGNDGGYPIGGLVRDAPGNLYGTTYGGGVYGNGTIFEVTPSGVETVLHPFLWADGAYPWDALVRDAAGNLYGTTSLGGSYGYGAVFKLAPPGTLSVLYSFTGGGDGKTPFGSLVRDAQGNLFGTTYSGGAYNYGTIFEVNSSGFERVLHSFTLIGRDGGNPYAGLVQDPNGTLYGTTYYGGKGNWGTIFMAIPVSNIYSPMYGFAAGADGAGPFGGLVEDPQGYLYGTTQWYGTNGGGAVFKWVP